MEPTISQSSGLLVRWKRSRNWPAAFMSFASVVLLVTSAVMPRWLERPSEFVETANGTRALSAALQIGIFRVCENSRLNSCFTYGQASKHSKADVLWDVQSGLKGHKSQRYLAQVCFVLSLLTATLGAVVSALMPSRGKCLRFLIGRALTALLHVLFCTLCVIIWHFWSGHDLRRSYSPHLPGSRLSPGPSFFLVFGSAVLGAIASCFNLYDVCRRPTGVQLLSSLLDSCGEEDGLSDHRLALARSFGVVDAHIPVQESDFPPPYCKDSNDNLTLRSDRLLSVAPPLYETVCLLSNSIPMLSSSSSNRQLPLQFDAVSSDTATSEMPIAVVVNGENPPAYTA